MHDIVIYRFAKKMHLAPRILGFWNSRKISPRRSHPFSLGINNLQGSVRSSLVHRSFKYIRIIDLSARKSTARPTNHFNVYETIFTPFHLLNNPPPSPVPVPFHRSLSFFYILLRYLCCLNWYYRTLYSLKSTFGSQHKLNESRK